MRILNKTQFLTKWNQDNSVKSFIANSRANHNLIAPQKANTNIAKHSQKQVVKQQKDDYEEMLFDLASARQTELVDIPIEKVLDHCTKLIGRSKEGDSNIEVNFTFGQLAKEVGDTQDSKDTIDITSSDI